MIYDRKGNEYERSVKNHILNLYQNIANNRKETCGSQSLGANLLDARNNLCNCKTWPDAYDKANRAKSGLVTTDYTSAKNLLQILYLACGGKANEMAANFHYWMALVSMWNVSYGRSKYEENISEKISKEDDQRIKENEDESISEDKDSHANDDDVSLSTDYGSINPSGGTHNSQNYSYYLYGGRGDSSRKLYVESGEGSGTTIFAGGYDCSASVSAAWHWALQLCHPELGYGESPSLDFNQWYTTESFRYIATDTELFEIWERNDQKWDTKNLQKGDLIVRVNNYMGHGEGHVIMYQEGKICTQFGPGYCSLDEFWRDATYVVHYTG